MSLDVKKFYVDTRFRTSDSRSNTDFNVEMPRNFTVPDNTVAYIDDIVIPVSWYTIDSRNNHVYIGLLNNLTYTYYYAQLTEENYTGASFAIELAGVLNTALFAEDVTVACTYDANQNQVKVEIADERSPAVGPLELYIYSEKDLKLGLWDSTPTVNTRTIAQILRLTYTNIISVGFPAIFHLDLHTTRNLYLISSALASYNSVSNFGNDTIIKKIPVKAGYNEMLFHDSGSGFDTLDVSKRTLRYLDFKLVDSFFNVIDLHDNHWSFSILFQQAH